MEAFLLNLPLNRAFLIGLILAAAYYTAMFDGGEKIIADTKRAKQQIVTLQREITGIEKALVDAKRFEKTANALGEQIEQISKAIPSDLEAFDLRKLVSTESKVVGANLVNVGAGQVTKGSDESQFLERVSVPVTIEATFVQTMMFLSNLTQVDKILTVDNIAFSPGSGSDDSGAKILSVVMDISAYRYVKKEKDDKS